MKQHVKVAGLLGLSVATLFGAGYKIPEQSLNSTALSAAYVANARGADASYYNPANMAFSPSGSDLEIALTYIGLSSVKYTDSANSSYNADSKSERFFVPTFHYMSPEFNNWRFGLSLVAPGGLSKRWDGGYQQATAKEFTLKILELNPTASYKINDKFAVGFGLRGVYTSGKIKAIKNNPTPAVELYSEDMTGDSIDFGYNLALSYLPMKNMTASATYRSKVDLTISGTAKGNINKYLLTHTTADLGTLIPYNTHTTVTIPLPAALNLAVAYTMNKTTVELVYERTYWSAYKNLDFNFSATIPEAVLGKSKSKNWKDTNTYRIGITHQYNSKLKLMAGFAIDQSPVPSNTLGFELPDSDAKLYSAGFEYKVNDKLKIGLAYLYDSKKSRTVANRVGTNGAPSGTFTNTSAQLLTASFKYKF